ncbi:hypothetical protein HPC49_15030 [Pyxidicoccus fallax]|uniref:PLD phosphodiesterase domain-containing protein n=1 Tax=Pyxidicoccus fallax TaxID=394095 RepID=A0A848LMW2_9BACT|nr:hypothetical protein [Pyxidicoccus fallax]NMO18914.1 hypothetical protein [Pyxidicoccus fallax]NPC79544.1 hypothetical protein [Pyxidicoccus fallax]
MHVQSEIIPPKADTSRRWVPVLLLSSQLLAGCDVTRVDEPPSVEQPGDATPVALSSPCGGVTVPLSPVGAAMRAAPNTSIPLATCTGMPDPWLFNMDELDTRLLRFAQTVHGQIDVTTSSFSHASLYFHNNLGWQEGLLTLHRNVGQRWGSSPVPHAQKPIVRLYIGDVLEELNNDGVKVRWDVEEIYPAITALLRQETLAGPETWNVRIAVGRSDGQLGGWNHSKLSIRDRIEVLATSYEVPEHEMAIHLAGEPAQHAADWFETIWAEKNIKCVGDTTLCGTVPAAPSVAATTPHPFRPVNVLALSRGHLDSGVKLDADRALIAGMGATQRSMFFINPGLVGFHLGHQGVFSPIFFEHVADAIARGVDVKFVWGDADEHRLGVEEWKRMQQNLINRFAYRGLNGVQRDVGLCMFHMAAYTDTRSGAKPTSHAKFYMLDSGFYVGSQNLYPSGFIGVAPTPELKEFGFFVDTAPGANEHLATEVINRVVKPVWDFSRLTVPPSEFVSCGGLAYPVRVAGAANTPMGRFTCASDFNLTLDFQRVEYDQVAHARGQTTCTSGPYTVIVGITGTIDTKGIFTGEIAGNLPGLTADTAPLTGTFVKGALNAAFTGLEPVRGVPYDGSLSVRMP